MNRFAALLDRLALEPSLDHKLRQLSVYFRETPDPDRGLALAAMTGGLPVAKIRADFLRALIAERVDLELFALGHDFVGDLPETIALMWPLDETRGHNRPPGPTLQDVVEALREGDRPGWRPELRGFSTSSTKTGAGRF